MSRSAWFLGGDAIGMRDPAGKKVIGDSLLIYLNASALELPVTLPGLEWGARWRVCLDTALALDGQSYACDGRFVVQSRSVVVLELIAADPAQQVTSS